MKEEKSTWKQKGKSRGREGWHAIYCAELVHSPTAGALEVRLQSPVSSLQLRGSSFLWSVCCQDTLRSFGALGELDKDGVSLKSSAGRRRIRKRRKEWKWNLYPGFPGEHCFWMVGHRHCMGSGWTDRRLAHCRYSITVLRWRVTESDRQLWKIIALLGASLTRPSLAVGLLHCTALQHTRHTGHTHLFLDLLVDVDDLVSCLCKPSIMKLGIYIERNNLSSPLFITTFQSLTHCTGKLRNLVYPRDSLTYHCHPTGG